MNSFTKFALLAGTALALSACETDTTFKPYCNFLFYQSAFSNTPELTLVPMDPGSMIDIPLNSILVNSPELGETLLPVAVGAERLASLNLKVSGRMQNCTDEPMTVLARTTFYDALNMETEAPSAWTQVFIPPRSRGVYQTSSLNPEAETFIIEIEAPR